MLGEEIDEELIVAGVVDDALHALEGLLLSCIQRGK